MDWSMKNKPGAILRGVLVVLMGATDDENNP
jgi:hypothetical protein